MPAFDPNIHEIDPKTGFQVDKDTGHFSGLVAKAPASGVVVDREWPKWVSVHESHINRRKTEGEPDYISTPAFPNFHVQRGAGDVTVLVRNEDEEKMAGAEYKAPDPDETDKNAHIDDVTRREVIADVAMAETALAVAAEQKLAIYREKMIEEEAARRVVAKQELAASNREAADKLAADGRQRVIDSGLVKADGPSSSYAGVQSQDLTNRRNAGLPDILVPAKNGINQPSAVGSIRSPAYVDGIARTGVPVAPITPDPRGPSTPYVPPVPEDPYIPAKEAIPAPSFPTVTE